MSRMRHSKPLQLLGLLSSLWLVLAGCGGQSGSDGSGRGGDSAPRVRHITLQLTRSTEVVSTARHQGIASAQVRLQPGEPGFIERLDIQVQTPQGADLLSPQPFPLGPADQEEVALNVAIPDPPPAQFQLLVSAFNNFNNQQTKIFLGQVLIQRGQESATLTLVRNPDRNTLIPVPATPGNLQQTVFTFTNGAVFGFGLAGKPATLTVGNFQGNTGNFTLVSGGFTSGGQVTIGSCTFVVLVSTFPPGQGPPVGAQTTFNPCNVEGVDGRLMLMNTSLNISAISEAPLEALPTSALVLQLTPLTLVTNEDTAGTVQIGAALVGDRPGGLTFNVTGLPAHGTAGVNSTTGLVIYTPAANFNGSDGLVVTVTATFTDGNVPSSLVGTVPIAITVQPVNDLPSLTSPGNQTTLEGVTVSLQMSASDPDGDVLTFSATGLPAGLSINATTGLISGTIPFTAVAGSPAQTFPVTITVSDGTLSASITFTWTVTNVNQAPVVTAPGNQTTPENQAVSVPIAASDADGDTLTFSATGLPPGLSINATTGVISGTIPFTAVVGSPAQTFPVTVMVSDGSAAPVSVSFTWTVTNVNQAPAVTAPGNQTTPENQAVSVPIAASDADGDTLTFSATGLPPGLSINATTGVISGTIPFTAVVGSPAQTFPVTVTVSDGSAAPVSVSFTWTVTNVNRPPQATSPGDQSNREGDTVSLPIAASDPDDDSLTFSATNLPPGLSINAATGRITGTVATGAAASSPYSVTVAVSDGSAAPVSVSFTWTIATLRLTVSIGSPPAPVAPGAMFTVPVTFTTGGINVLSYLFQLSFNSSVVQVVNIGGLTPFDTVVTNSAAFASGLVKFAANNSTFTPVHGVFNIADITFQVVGNAGTTSALQLAFTPTPGGASVLVNDAFQPIADVTFTSGSVTVSGP